MRQFSRHVRNGIALLDSAMPGWAAKVDPSTLAMGDDKRCVLGQLYYASDSATLFPCDGSPYAAVAWELGLHPYATGVGPESTTAHGFDWIIDDVHPCRAEAILTRMWRLVITRRQSTSDGA